MTLPFKIWYAPPNSIAIPISCIFSAFLLPTSCVSTAFAHREWYYVDVGSSRIAATVASSDSSRQPNSKSFAAVSPSGSPGSVLKLRMAASPSMPSLIRTNISPRRRDSLSTVSRTPVTDRPGGGAAVPIFSAPAGVMR